MILKYLFKSLFKSKLLILIIGICYASSIAAVCHVYSYEKNLVLRSNKLAFIAVPKEKLSLQDGNTIAKSMRESRFNDDIVFDVGNGGVVYFENKVDSNAVFTGGNEVIISSRLPKRINDTIAINDKTYKVIGYTYGIYEYVFNIDNFSEDYSLGSIMYIGTGIVTQSALNKINSVFSPYFDHFDISLPQKTQVIKEITEHPFFILVCILVALSMITAIVINAYLLRQQKKLASVMLSLGCNNLVVMLYLILEQLIIIVPMLLIGVGVYFVIYAFISDIIALMNLMDILFLFTVFVVLLLSLTAINYIAMMRRKNV